MDNSPEKKSILALTNSFGEKYLPQVNGSLFANIDSETLFTKKYQNHFLKESSLYIISGTDSGLFLKYILGHSLPKGTRVIFIELEEIYSWIKQQEIMQNLPNNIALVTLQDFPDKIIEFNVYNYIYLDNLHFIKSFASLDLHYQHYNKLNQYVQQLLEDHHWSIKASLQSKAFILNQVKNVQDNITSASELFGKFKGQSALLMAGGPSLDSACQWIKQNRDRYVIIAVSRISNKLYKEGIVPDIIFSIDPNPISFDLSREMFHFSTSSLLISAHHIYPPLLAQWPGRCAYFGPLLPWNSPLNISQKEPEGSTVTNVALECALEMGFSQIVLFGVDLCYSPQGISYATGSKNDEEGTRVDGGETTIETNAGQMAETLFGYKAAAQHLSSLSQSDVAKDCRIINTSINAAKMDGIAYIEKSALNLPLTNQMSKELAAFGVPQSLEETIKWLNTLHEEIDTIRGKLKRIIHISGIAKRKSLELAAKNSTGISKKVEAINAIENKLNSTEFANITNTVKAFGIDSFIKIVKHSKELSGSKQKQKLNPTELSEAFSEYYLAYSEASSDLLERLNDSVKRIHSRREECNPQGDTRAITAQWEQDRTPGRVYIWERNHAPQLEFDIYKQDFEKILSGSSSYSKEFTYRWGGWTAARLKKLRLKIVEAFQSKDQKELQQLTTELFSKPQSGYYKDTIKSLAHLTAGMHDELQNTFDTALSHYNKVIELGSDIDSMYLEDALKRVAAISIAQKDYTNATLALQCLSDLSDFYAPQYAKILTLTGETDKALDVYAFYLAKAPQDIETMLQLGNAYSSLNLPEGMLFAANHVLGFSPNNKSALHLKTLAEKIQKSSN